MSARLHASTAAVLLPIAAAHPAGSFPDDYRTSAHAQPGTRRRLAAHSPPNASRSKNNQPQKARIPRDTSPSSEPVQTPPLPSTAAPTRILRGAPANRQTAPARPRDD